LPRDGTSAAARRSPTDGTAPRPNPSSRDCCYREHVSNGAPVRPITLKAVYRTSLLNADVDPMAQAFSGAPVSERQPPPTRSVIARDQDAFTLVRELVDANQNVTAKRKDLEI